MYVGACFHIGDVCGNAFRSADCVHLGVCQFLCGSWVSDVVGPCGKGPGLVPTLPHSYL